MGGVIFAQDFLYNKQNYKQKQNRLSFLVRDINNIGKEKKQENA